MASLQCPSCHRHFVREFVVEPRACPFCQSTLPVKMSLICPSCRRQFLDDFLTPKDTCPFCSKPIPVKSVERPCVRQGVDLRMVAKWHRRLRGALLLAVAGYLPFILFWITRTPPPPARFYSVLLLFVYVLAAPIMLVATLQLMRAMRMGRTAIVVCAFLLLSYYAGLPLMLGVNVMASIALRKAGLHVGLMGVRDEEVVRMLTPNLCRQCGYDLTGNVSGRCPECGTLIPLSAVL